jgi:hypothetical protein
MSGHDHSHARQSLLTQLQLASLKHLDEFPAVPPRHARRRWMSQRALDLGALQEQIASPSRNARGTYQQKLSDDSPIAIGSRRTSAISGGNAKCFTLAVIARSAEASSLR